MPAPENKDITENTDRTSSLTVVFQSENPMESKYSAMLICPSMPAAAFKTTLDTLNSARTRSMGTILSLILRMQRTIILSCRTSISI